PKHNESRPLDGFQDLDTGISLFQQQVISYGPNGLLQRLRTGALRPVFYGEIARGNIYGGRYNTRSAPDDAFGAVGTGSAGHMQHGEGFRDRFHTCKVDKKPPPGRYTILVLIYKIYTLSRGFRLSSRICLKWLGVSPVIFLN